MFEAPRARRPSRRTAAFVLTTSLVAGGLVALAPGAHATVNTCRARNVTKGRPARRNLQVAIDAADPGDTISVRYVCIGNFTIAKDLRLAGRSTGAVPRPVLYANGAAGRVLTVSGDVRLANLVITGGSVTDASYPLENDGGGILNDGTLLLHDTVVRGNRANDHGGGIYNGATGTLTLNGSSRVHGNRSDHGGGIANFGIATLDGSSSVNGNAVRHFIHGRLGGGIYNEGVLTMNDSSSVRGNRGFFSPGSGIFNSGGAVTLNDSSTVRGNTGLSGSFAAGIDNARGALTLNDRSSVRGNTSSGHSGGILNRRGTVDLNGSSSVTHNTTDGQGGGIENISGTVTLDGRSSVTRNTAGSGGGISNSDVLYACTTWAGAISPNKPNDPPTPTVISC